MSWTDERVERLSKLWMEGRSASHIAADLGEGVSRNAVIGKIHRLGLSNRATPPAAADADRLKLKAAMKPAVSAPDGAEPVPAPSEPRSSAGLAALAQRDVVIPFSTRVTIMDLRETMCRWPIGDPTSSEFRFCGCRTSSNIPYCPTHASVAFQPIAERRRVERVARIA